jgi:hypothetical protein
LESVDAILLADLFSVRYQGGRKSQRLLYCLERARKIERLEVT